MFYVYNSLIIRPILILIKVQDFIDIYWCLNKLCRQQQQQNNRASFPMKLINLKKFTHGAFWLIWLALILKIDFVDCKGTGVISASGG